jgi:serine phosphatase RsbU (regulator of sigma subunit)/anti-sigma regulatory factor (Ser/Thr protein kinase)
MPERSSPTRITNFAFLVFFVLYTAGSIIWLLSGVPPILADRIHAVHQTLHRWGASDRGYVAISSDGDLGQRVTAGSRWVEAKELAVWANTPVVVHFENLDPRHRHNFAVYDGNRAIFHGPPIVGPDPTEITFTAPRPGRYLFRDELSPSQPAELVAVERGWEIPAWARWIPGLRTAALGAAIESHALPPGRQILLQYLFSALNIGLGILLIRLRPNDLAARLLALGMVGTAAVFNAPAHSGLQEMPWLAQRLHDNYHLFAGLAYVLALLVFPDGRLPAAWSRRRWVTWPLLAFFLAVAAVFFNHVRVHGDPPGLVAFFGVLVPVAGITSQSFRLHQAASAAQRQQSRVLVWALSLALGAALFLFGLRAMLGSALEQELQGLAFVVFPVLFAAIPLTLTAVLVRYRLWDMDQVINQTLVYGTLTGVLGLAYVASVAVLQRLLIWPIVRRNNLTLVAFTVAAALLFRPARDRIQAFIDRRFYRSKYDAAKTLEAFSTRIRDEIDLDTVADELLVAAEETMQPARMALWLRPGDGAAEEDQGAASSPNRPGRTEAVPVQVGRDDAIIAHLEAATAPVALDELDVVSPARDALQGAAMRLVVPLVSQARLVGLLGLGPRRSGRDYASDDRKLLEDLAKRAAPALRVAQLVRQLVRQQADELQARERIEQELQVAQLIQRQFLPRELPELSGWYVATYYQPAKAVGGDFYDFIELPDGLIGLVCGDVTDKGVPAALLMATTHSILRGDAFRLISPGKVLERTNELLLAETPAQMFVTCLYGVLDPATGRLRYANAGHNPPYMQTTDGVVELRATGMPLGLMPAMRYEEREATLAPGDTLLLHSDGLVEAHNPKRRMFGFPRLKALVGECPGGRQLIDRLLGELRGFTGPGWQQEDDITLVTIQRAALPAVLGSPAAVGTGSHDPGARVVAEFSVPSEPSNERVAMARVAQAVANLDLPVSRLERLKTAVAEAVMNAIEHGNRNRPELGVDIAVLASPSLLSVRVTDHGSGRLLLEPETPDLDAKLAGRQPPRGWGLFLIKNMVDELAVTGDERHHTVELIFHLKPAGARP